MESRNMSSEPPTTSNLDASTKSQNIVILYCPPNNLNNASTSQNLCNQSSISWHDPAGNSDIAPTSQNLGTQHCELNKVYNGQESGMQILGKERFASEKRNDNITSNANYVQEKLDNVVKDIKEQVKMKDKEIMELKEKVKSLNDNNYRLKVENETLSNENHQLQREKDNLKTKVKNLEEDKRAIATAHNGLQSVIEDLKKKATKDEAAFKKKDLELRQQLKCDEMIAQKINRLNGDIHRLKLENENLRAERAQKESENENLRTERAQKESENENLRTERAQKESENENLRTERAQKESENENLRTEKVKKESEYENLKRNFISLWELKRYLSLKVLKEEDEYDALHIDFTEMEGQLVTAMLEIEKLKDQKATLELTALQQLEMLEQYNNQHDDDEPSRKKPRTGDSDYEGEEPRTGDSDLEGEEPIGNPDKDD